MKIRTKLLSWTTTASLLILTTVLTTSCGSTKTETTTNEAPKTESPKAAESPKPPESPKAASPSGSTFTNEKTQASSTASGEGKFADVKINKLETYTHPGGVFSMDVPEGWTKQDQSQPGQVLVSWTDATGNSVIIANISDAEATLSKEDLGSNLKKKFTEVFSVQPKFQISDAKEQPDGTMRVEWSYEVTAQSQTETVLGNSFIEQKGNKIAIFSIGVLNSQFDKLKDNMNKIIASRKINPDAKVGE